MYRDMLKAAKGGNTYAMLSLAYCYHYGIHVDQDPEEAIKWYKQSAAKGCGRARWELAKFYHQGTLVTPNGYEYIHWLTSAAEAGIPEAMTQLSKVYSNGVLVPKDTMLGTIWLQRAAEMEFAFAEFLMAYLYDHGYEVPLDHAAAEEFRARCRQHGDADLFYSIGSLLEFGDSLIDASLDEAVPWYRMSADMGSSKGYFCFMRAQQILGGGKPDTYEQRQAKLSHLPDVMEKMQSDILLEEADSCIDDADYEGAIQKYRESADLGNPDALFMLSLLYRDGDLVKRNTSLSLDYLTRSAMSGNTDAQVQLARFYETGEGGCAKNLDEAMKYYAMAISCGNLSVYYQLTKYIDHPERYVNSIRKVVR